MKVYLHWNNEMGAQVVEKEGDISAFALPFRSVEELLLQTCDDFGVAEVYGSNPPFGLTEKFREITLHYIPVHKNPAAFYLVYALSLGEPKAGSLKIKWHDGKAEVDGYYVTLPALACSCPHKFSTTPCKHVVAVAHAIPPHEFVKYLKRFIAGEPIGKREEDVGEVEVTKPPPISSILWDCSRLGCYLQRRRPRLEVIEDKIKSIKGVTPAFFNIDGMALVNTKPVVIEWKVSPSYPKGQYVLLRELSRRGVIVFVVCGDPMSMVVEAVQVFKDGKPTDFMPLRDLDELVDMIIKEAWGS